MQNNHILSNAYDVTLVDLQDQKTCNHSSSENSETAFAELKEFMFSALTAYSNVHRGSGYNSIITTNLYELSRKKILKHLGLNPRSYEVIFCSPRIGLILSKKLSFSDVHVLSSKDLGLALGVVAIATRKKTLAKIEPVHTGGGAARLVSTKQITWARSPDLFEAGTPSVINIVTFCKALELTKKYGSEIFFEVPKEHNKETDIIEKLFHNDFNGVSGNTLLDCLRSSVIGANTLVPTEQGHRPFVNLDNAASTRTFLPVWDSVTSSLHMSKNNSIAAAAAVREICAQTLGAPSSEYEVIFTANATEAINLAAESFSLKTQNDVKPVVLCSDMEHTSNDLPWRKFSGAETYQFETDDEGFVDLQTLENILVEYNLEHRHGNKRVMLVAMSGASNVLGSYNPIKEIGELVHRFGARLLVDGAQMAAHRSVCLSDWDADYFVFSGHKVYAPFGAGALVVKQGILSFNKEQRAFIKELGEENTVGIASLGKALILLERVGMENIRQKEHELTALALKGLSAIKEVTVYGVRDLSSPKFADKGGVIVFDIKNRVATGIADELAQRAGIGVRAGCHCAHMTIKKLLRLSSALQKFQHLIVYIFPNLKLPGMTRVSFGIENTENDVKLLIETINDIVKKKPLKQSRSKFKESILSLQNNI